MKRKILFAIIFIFTIIHYSKSQNFVWESIIETGNKDGFYSILLTEPISSRTKIDLSDIRVFDKKENEIPYIVDKEQTEYRSHIFKEYKIIEKKHFSKKGYTRLVIHNPKREKLSAINLIIQNSEVKKWLKINGSNNKKNWYVVKDKYTFESINNTKETSEIKIVNFPLNNYEYYELIIFDFFNKPINILKAGFYETIIEKGKYSPIKEPFISQNDSSMKNYSIVTVNFQRPQYIDKLVFDINKRGFYKRKSTLHVKKKKYKNKQLTTFYERFAEIDFSSETKNELLLPSIQLRDIHIFIENGDDKPLKINHVKAYFLNRYLIAKLKKNTKYRVRFGDKKLYPPNYDLKHFKNKIPKTADLPQIIAGKKVRYIYKEKKEVTIENIFFNKTFLWSTIIFVILFLGFMTVKMLREMKN